MIKFKDFLYLIAAKTQVHSAQPTQHLLTATARKTTYLSWRRTAELRAIVETRTGNAEGGRSRGCVGGLTRIG